MNAINFNGGGSLSIEKILDQGVFASFKFEEGLYGSAPTMEIKIQSDIEPCSLNELLHGQFRFDDGSKVEFQAYPYSISGFFRDWEIKLLLLPPEMTRQTYSTSYPGIIRAIKSTCTNLKSDLVWNEPLDSEDGIFQINETNLNFLNRISWMYRKGVVFGHTINGTVFVDTNDYKSMFTFVDGTDIHIQTTPEFTSSKLYSKDTDLCNYSIDQDQYHTIIQYDHHLVFANKEYTQVIENALYNKRFNTSAMIVNGTTPAMLNLPSGSMIELKSERVNFKRCMISNRVISIDKGGQTKVSYTIQSLLVDGRN